MMPHLAPPPPRRADWQLHLMQYLAERARTAVDPAGPVCAEFVAGGIEAMTGEPLALQWRGKYRSAKAGLRALKKLGFADHIAVVAAIYAEIPVAMAAPGDIAVVPAAGIDALGLVQGASIYVQAEGGIGAVPLVSAGRAFRVI